MKETVYRINAYTDNYKESKKKLDELLEPVQKSDPIITLNPPLVRYHRVFDDQRSEALHQRDTFTIKLPKQGFLDTSSIRLLFNLRPLLTLTNANPSDIGFSWDINTIFKRVVLRLGSIEIDAINEYGFLSHIHSCLFDDGFANGHGQAGIMEGKQPLSSTTYNNSNFTRGSYHLRNGGGVPNPYTSRKYMVPINLGLLQQKKLIPLDYFGEALTIQFYIEEASRVIISQSTVNVLSQAADLELSTPYLLFKTYNGPPSFKHEFDIMVKNANLNFQYVSWDYNRFTLTTNINQTFQIKTKRKFLKYAIACIRCDQDQGNIYYDSYGTYIQSNPDQTLVQGRPSNTITTAQGRHIAKITTLKSYQWSIGNKKFPDIPVNVIQTKQVEDNIGTAGNLFIAVPPHCECWYYLTQLCDGLQRKTQMGNTVTEQAFFSIDSNTSNGAQNYGANANFNSAFPNSRYSYKFFMIGIFNHNMPYGGNVCASAGALTNDALNLSLEFNYPSFDTGYFSSATGTAGPPMTCQAPPMFVDVFTCYDNYLTVYENGSALLEN